MFVLVFNLLFHLSNIIVDLDIIYDLKLDMATDNSLSKLTNDNQSVDLEIPVMTTSQLSVEMGENNPIDLDTETKNDKISSK